MTEGFALFEVIEGKGASAGDYRFFEVNAAFEKLTGLKRENILGKLRGSVLGKDQFTKIYDEVTKSGTPLRFTDYSKALERYYDILAFRPEKGRLAILLSDVTGRKQEDAAKNNFIAIMAHELRNPLMPIFTNAEMLDIYLSENSRQRRSTDPKMKEAVEAIARQAKTLGRLLDDLLDISRIIRGKIILRKKPISIYPSIQNAVETARPLMESQKHEFSRSFPFSPVYVNADPIRIEQVVTNLLNNAAKYTKPGGKISLAVEKKSDGTVDIKVRDTGIGIKSQDINNMFKLFAQFSKPFVETHGDFGVGLKIIKDIVVMHGGTISVKSSGIGKGSEFTVSLPTIDAITEEAPKSQKNGSAHGIKRRILIVDDNKDISGSLKHILAHLGHEVETANSGVDALAAAKIFAPEIVLLDIGLPDMSGYEVARRLRETYRETLKIVALTGYGQEKDKALAKEAGFEHHLTKPVSVNNINRIIKKCFP
jgi:signal transduction histidine kinase